MGPERVLAAGAAGVVVVSLVLALALPGAVASPDQEIRRPGPVGVDEVAIQPGTVSGATVELQVRAQVAHRGNPTPNVSVRFRATDAESGTVAAERTVDLGELRDEGWHPANATLRVAREGGYDVEVTVFHDGRPVDASTRSVRGLEGLTPEYAATEVGFAERGSIPAVAVSVESAGDDRVTLRIASRLTNEGDDPSGDLELVVVVRQAESNLVADETTAAVGSIRPGRTERVESTVEVAAEYNYYVDVELHKDGVLVDATRGVANLDPTERISANQTLREVEFDVGDFERDDDRAPDRGRTPTAAQTSTPGFGVVAALGALLTVLLFARFRRWSR
jgi:hypothetical protein